MTYTPTKEELEEMGFIREETQYEYGNIVFHDDKAWEIFMIDENGVWASIEMFPRSKEHLEQIILAFTK